MSRALVIVPKNCVHECIVAQLNSRAEIDVVQHIEKLSKALPLVESWPGYDVVFVSSYLDDDQIANFLERAREREIGHKATYVLLLDDKHETRLTLANNLLLGFHGFLAIPINSESLDEIISISTKVRQQDSELRLRVATGLVLTEMRDNAGIKLESDHQANAYQQSEASCEWYKDITGKSVTVEVVKKLKRMPPTMRMLTYKGVSQRVKALFEKPFTLLISTSKEES